MGRHRQDNLGLLAVFISIMCIIIFLVMVPASTFGLDSGLLGNIIAVLPGLLIGIIGIIGIGESHGSALIVGGFGAAGLGLAVLMGEMYSAGIINDVVLAGMTLGQLETITVILSLVMGGVAYSMRR